MEEQLAEMADALIEQIDQFESLCSTQAHLADQMFELRLTLHQAKIALITIRVCHLQRLLDEARAAEKKEV